MLEIEYALRFAVKDDINIEFGVESNELMVEYVDALECAHTSDWNLTPPHTITHCDGGSVTVSRLTNIHKALLGGKKPHTIVVPYDTPCDILFRIKKISPSTRVIGFFKDATGRLYSSLYLNV